MGDTKGGGGISMPGEYERVTLKGRKSTFRVERGYKSGGKRIRSIHGQGPLMQPSIAQGGHETGDGE